jgi:UDP-glucose 4-epimerase
MNYWSGKCVVVTGASGFVGSAVVERLAGEPDLRVVRVGRSLADSRDDIASALEDLNVECWRRHGVERIDSVIHLGGFIPKTPDAGMSVEENFASNIAGTRSLFESLPNVPTTTVFASSVDVYTRTGDVLTERSPIDPATLYGASKLFLEKYVTLHARERAASAIVLRLGHIYGPGEGSFHKFIPNTIRAMLQGKSPVINGDGSTLRDYLYVTDAAEAIVRAASLAVYSGGPINVVSGTSVSMHALADLLAELTGYRGVVDYRSESPGGVSLQFDDALVRSVLGEMQPLPLRSGLALEIESFRIGRDA